MSPWKKILNTLWVRLWSQWWVHPPVLPFSSHFSPQNPDMLFWWRFVVMPVLLVSPFQLLVVLRSFAECSWTASQLHVENIARGLAGSETALSKILPCTCSQNLGQPFLVSVSAFFCLTLCCSCTSFIFSDPSKITNSSSLSQPQVSLWLWDVFILMQSSTHFQPTRYLTSEPSVWDPSPTLSSPPLLLWSPKYEVDGSFPLGQ